MDEREAVDRLKRGEVGALEALVRRYHARAGRTAYLIVRDHALAEDVAQDAFVRAYKGIGRFDSGRPFGPWFMRIVVNEAVGAARRRERTVSYEGRDAGAPVEWLADSAAGPHELAEEAEQRRRVWVALAKLPPAQRAVVVQRYYLGMSEAEMAEGGGHPKGTIKSRLHAARRGLSRLLLSEKCVLPAPGTRDRGLRPRDAPPAGSPLYPPKEESP
jgi:RNA polymerase sigma-70 factor, ECF subfamily